MNKTAKLTKNVAHEAIPLFGSEEEERVYWETHDSTVHLDWSRRASLLGNSRLHGTSGLEPSAAGIPTPSKTDHKNDFPASATALAGCDQVGG
jgi:Protein of unknown function (DUF3680).